MPDLKTMDDVVSADVPVLEGAEAVAPDALFADGVRDENAFGGALGLRKGPAFTDSERDRMKEMIKAHLVDTAKGFSADAAAEVRAVDLELYHEISDRLDHRQLLSKKGRIMTDEAVQEMKGMSFFDYARKAFGADHYLSDEEGIGHEQVCLRVVRPNVREDVGSLHADHWFWEHYDWAPPPGEGRTKMWMGVCVDGVQNGLRLAPGSHRENRPYRVVRDGHKIAFAPDFDLNTLDLRVFDAKPGEPILFNYRTLHVGTFNTAPTTRVSVEITFMYKEDQQARSAA